MSTATVETTKSWGGGKSPFNVEYGKLMMWYFLMSDAFTFGAFLISYGTIRFSTNGWPDPNEVFRSFPFAPEGVHAPLVFVSVMTFILIVSSVTMVLAVKAGHEMDKKSVVKYMIWTIIGGIAFLACQAWEWTHLNHQGAWWGSFTDPATALSSFEHLFTADKAVIAQHGLQATHDFYNYFFK